MCWCLVCSCLVYDRAMLVRVREAQTLANLDDIKKRNRPAEAPKAPEEAPFFLPTLPGLQPVFVPEGKEGKEGKAGHKSREVRREGGRGGWCARLLSRPAAGTRFPAFCHVCLHAT